MLHPGPHAHYFSWPNLSHHVATGWPNARKQCCHMLRPNVLIVWPGLVRKNTTQCPQPELEPGPNDPESSALTRNQNLFVLATYRNSKTKEITFDLSHQMDNALNQSELKAKTCEKEARGNVQSCLTRESLRPLFSTGKHTTGV